MGKRIVTVGGLVLCVCVVALSVLWRRTTGSSACAEAESATHRHLTQDDRKRKSVHERGRLIRERMQGKEGFLKKDNQNDARETRNGHAESSRSAADRKTDSFRDLLEKTLAADDVTHVKNLPKKEIFKGLWTLAEDGSAEARQLAMKGVGLVFAKAPLSPETDMTGENAEEGGEMIVDIAEMEKVFQEGRDVAELLDTGLRDSDADVRREALESLFAVEESIRTEALLTALESSDEDLRYSVIERTAGIENLDYLVYQMSAINDPSEKVRELARENTKNYTGQDFTSADQALDWLEANIDKPNQGIEPLETSEEKTAEEAAS